MKTSYPQIVATIGPATKTQKIVDSLVKNGMTAARLNFSWGTYKEHEYYIKLIRSAAKKYGKRIPIIQDLSGPRMQTKGGHGFDSRKTKVLTPKDIRDVRFGLSCNIEYVAMSYVGNAGDVVNIKNIIREFGGTAKVVAKIERKMALNNLDKIIRAADAVMVARGDLGNEIPIETMPFVSEKIITKCNKAKKPVITATQMLFSMTEQPYPTRAEVTDVAFAVIMGSDAVMLSDETARGKHPVNAVTIMNKIVREAIKYMPRTTNPL